MKPSTRLTHYVTGGAQGSLQVNRLVAAVLDTVLQRANMIHQCGRTSLAQLRRRAEQLPAELAGRYRVIEFVGPELPDVLALADVVVSRSGAGTLAELTALGKPSVLIPLVPTGGNEQVHNARYLQQAGAAHALLTDQPTPQDLARALDGLIGDAGLRLGDKPPSHQPAQLTTLAPVSVTLAGMGGHPQR